MKNYFDSLESFKSLNLSRYSKRLILSSFPAGGFVFEGAIFGNIAPSKTKPPAEKIILKAGTWNNGIGS